MGSLKVQITALIAVIGNGVAGVFKLLPDVIFYLNGIGGLIILYTIYRKNRAEERKFIAQAEKLEAKEKARQSEIEQRQEKGLPCRRCTDDEIE